MARYVPETVADLRDYLSAMASNAPAYDSVFFEERSPEGEFDRIRQALANVRSKLGEQAYAYLLARIEENWIRLQTGKEEDLRKLKLSFGEMSHFLSIRKYKTVDLNDDLVAHTAVRAERKAE